MLHLIYAIFAETHRLRKTNKFITRKVEIMSFETVIERQEAISTGKAPNLEIPKYRNYVMGNLRGGIGKTTLSFNLSYLTDEILVIDTCPQGNLSYFYDRNYYSGPGTTVQDMILPYIIPGLGKATHVANCIEATNQFFKGKQSYFIQSSSELYLLPTRLTTAIDLTSDLPSPQKESSRDSILFCLRDEIAREMKENSLNKSLIDTSPFFAGATQLAWYAADALVIPVRTDQQSINSLELLIKTLTTPGSPFRRPLTPENERYVPKIHMVVLTHCGWSTVAGARNVPNQQTKVYLRRLYDILSKHKNLLTTGDPDNHLFMLDDFLGSGRISSIEAKPIELLQAGETKTIDRVRVSVSQAVDKCKNQLKYICNQLW